MAKIFAYFCHLQHKSVADQGKVPIPHPLIILSVTGKINLSLINGQPTLLTSHSTGD